MKRQKWIFLKKLSLIEYKNIKHISLIYMYVIFFFFFLNISLEVAIKSNKGK